METVTKKYTIYNFDELSEEMQQELIEKETQAQHEGYCEAFLYSDMEEKAKELLQKYFGNRAELKDVYYSLSYCQGDGAMFEFDGYYYNKYFKVKQSGFYYHKNSYIIDDISTYSEYLTDKQEEKLKNKINKMFSEFEAYGWKCVDYRITEDEAKDFLRDFKYLENGKVF